MNVERGLLEQFVAVLAAELGPRVAAELAATGPSGEEAWRLWSLDDVCARLGRSERTVRGWAKRGELPFVRLDGGALAFLPEDVQAFARARRVPAVEGEVLEPRLQVVREAAVGAGSRGGHRAVDRRVEPS